MLTNKRNRCYRYTGMIFFFTYEQAYDSHNNVSNPDVKTPNMKTNLSPTGM